MTHPLFIQQLLTRQPYPHSTGKIELRETHISWLLLTGDVAYKIKKPVDFGFVNFSTLEKRHHFCEEEVRLNRRLAPGIYQDVVAITGDAHAPCVGRDGDAFEYAVRMRQFDESQILLALLQAGELTAKLIDELAKVIAEFHGRIDRASESTEWGTLDQIRAPVVGNFEVMRPLIAEPSRLRQLGRLEQWSRERLESLSDTFASRRLQGFVRECHGDLHLRNIVVWQGRVTPFDCIEFNPGFRWIDTASEIAFLMMDLDDHGRADLRRRFLNKYLEETGDFGCLLVLRFYEAYRAAVRAKVDLLRLQQGVESRLEETQIVEEWHRYLDLAESYAEPTAPRLIITHGLSGSGKTFGTERLLDQIDAIRIRSDIERHRGSQTRAESDRYSDRARDAVYDRLADLANEILRAGYSVIVDATFLRFRQRQQFLALAQQWKIPFEILPFDADIDTLRARIRSRQGDASEATVAVLEEQIKSREPLRPEEEPFVTTVAGRG